MKANELMVGDWVMRKQCFGKNANIITDVYRVDAITKEDLYLIEENKRYISKYCNTEIVPIPLTSEILEKNGFELRQKIYELVPPKNVEFVLIGFEDGCIDWCRVRSLGGEYFGSIRFVHELQHALRLCGIEKEIEL